LGLFDVFKNNKEKEKKEEFTPQTIKTGNVAHSLKEISEKYNIPLSKLDVDILSVDTYIKLSQDSDFVIADQETINLIKTKDLLLDPNLEIKQSYEIRIRKYQFIDDFELIGKLKVDKDLTHAIYYVSPESLLNYDETLEFRIIEELNKKKVKSGMLINTDLFETNFLDDVQQLVAKIRILGTIENEFEIELCQAISPIKPVRLTILEHYKKHQKQDDRVKEFIYPIKENEVIIEIIKPKPGKNGRSCRGKIIEVKDVKSEEVPEFKITDDVTKKEDDDSILYIANKSGYIYIEDNTISIKDEIEVNQISLKTGNVKGAEDSNVKLEVKESGVLKEAIKDGMVVETTELVVKGNIGKGAKIKAQKLEVDGQTHKDAKIIAKNAEINSHKGYLKANTALINRLEGGIVEAKQVHITQAVSGKIIAKEIKIDILGSHLTIIASELIEINNLKGSENKFIIDEGIVENREEYIESLEEKLKELGIEYRQYKDRYLKNKKTIQENKTAIDTIKYKIKQKRDQKLPVEPIYIQKVKKFNDFVKKTKLIEEKIKLIKEKQKKIKDELAKLQNGAFLARIISHNGFNEFNRIEFHLIEPPMKITYDTKKHDKLKNIFKLKDYGEMEYKIVGEGE